LKKHSFSVSGYCYCGGIRRVTIAFVFVIIIVVVVVIGGGFLILVVVQKIHKHIACKLSSQ
jgi:hypothetical protein